MKALVVQDYGRSPAYTDFPDPAVGPGEVRVAVNAAAMSQVVKGRAAGSHYSASGGLPFVAGIDGVGRLDDGRRVWFVLPRDPFGSMAEQTVVPVAQCLVLPDDLDDLTAAAIANPGMSSWVAYTERARLQPGETVLVNGATATSGRLAVQIARHLGAGKIIATGRDAEALREVAALGADVTIPLTEDTDALEERFKEQFAQGVDVVVDYLWGMSAECLLIAGAKTGRPGTPIRVIQIGSVSGATITLPSAVLRASAIELMGAGHGAVPLDRHLAAVEALLKAVAPANLKIAFRAVPLSDGTRAWDRDDSRNRTVFVV